MPDSVAREALETYDRFVARREEIDRGEERWSSLADFFTEDAAYIDPAWGRIEGREGIRTFFEESMAGQELPSEVGIAVGAADDQVQRHVPNAEGA